MKKIMAVIVTLFMGLTMATLTPAHGQSAPLESITCVGTVTGDYEPEIRAGEVVPPTSFDYKSVDVPEGKSCTLVNVAVKGNVKSLHGSKNVRVLDSYVGGNVHVKGATGTVHVGQAGCKYDPSVRVNVLVYDSHHVLVCWVDAHNVQLKRNDGRITVRDSEAHRFDVSQNKKCVKCKNGHRNPTAIRLLRNVSETHIHVFKNHKSRDVILRDNTPTPIVK